VLGVFACAEGRWPDTMIKITKHTWNVRVDARLRPLVEQIANEEQREASQVLRRLVVSALVQRGLLQKDAPEAAA
jgi:hypothetical protein